MSTAKAVDFDKSFAKLEKILQKLEQSSDSLSKSIELYEQGSELIKECRGALTIAEQKVNKVVEKNGKIGEVEWQK